MFLYRAMCEAEAIETLRDQRPAFLRRYKWFSPDIDFVAGRVMDGQFGGSGNKPERYTALLRFEVLDGTERFEQGQREWRLDRRRRQGVRWGRIERGAVCSTRC